MELTYLQYFLRVAEIGSINRAAADLNLSQPALSRNIAALENEIGSPLFTRRRDGVTLTEAGRLLADRTRPLLSQFALIKEEVGQRAAGHLTIGLPQAWKNVFTLSFISDLVKQHPGVAVKIHDGVSNTLREYLAAGILDLCIMPFEPVTLNGYVQSPLVRESMIAIGDATAEFRPYNELPLTALDNARLVMPGRTNVLRQHAEQAFMRKGISMRMLIEPFTQDLCIECARDGLGIAITPASSVQGYANPESLRWAPLKGLYATWSLYENEARAHSEAVRAAKHLIMKRFSSPANLWFGAELVTVSNIVKAVPSKSCAPRIPPERSPAVRIASLKEEVRCD
ncbi:MAG: LysR family transcriptional regulator [Paraburkholderia sp.]|uniref:LysR family transcriptional regulator n=1 Tax=Paraburkholderia sp. TaxID=1926495 RepID=UPI0011FF6D24|nr:LysR family transcriptional regulator [Paraburkholderia sp.]TAL98694.1 MAG: LysR family transcriptional regulator [Paraburkholderia sp.]